jgi:hypothetical protein
MARKKAKKTEIVEEAQVIKESPVIEEEVAKTEETVEKVEEVTKEPEVIEEKSREKKILEGAKAREEMKKAWQKRIKGDSITNLYSYNIGSLL